MDRVPDKLHGYTVDDLTYRVDLRTHEIYRLLRDGILVRRGVRVSLRKYQSLPIVVTHADVETFADTLREHYPDAPADPFACIRFALIVADDRRDTERREALSRGYTVADVAERTKLSVRKLYALIRGGLCVQPGGKGRAGLWVRLELEQTPQTIVTQANIESFAVKLREHFPEAPEEPFDCIRYAVFATSERRTCDAVDIHYLRIPDTINPAELSRLLGVTVSRVNNWIYVGTNINGDMVRLPCYKEKSGRVFLKSSEIRCFLKRYNSRFSRPASPESADPPQTPAG